MGLTRNLAYLDEICPLKYFYGGLFVPPPPGRISNLFQEERTNPSLYT